MQKIKQDGMMGTALLQKTELRTGPGGQGQALGLSVSGGGNRGRGCTRSPRGARRSQRLGTVSQRKEAVRR